MIPSNQKIPSWLKTPNGRARLTTTNDAIFYARLIYDDDQAICELKSHHAELREKLKQLSQKDDPDLDNMMEIAVQAQLFRECLDEVKRIKEELL